MRGVAFVLGWIAMLVGCSAEPPPPARALRPRPPAEHAEAPTPKAPSVEAQLRACTGPVPDQAALCVQLEGGRYAEVEAGLEALERAYAADPQCEENVWIAFAGLNRCPAPLLDRWVEARPDSWAALTARGGHWTRAGYDSRGSAQSRDVAEERWRGMRDAFARAESDLMRAMELEPNAFVLVGYAMRLARASGGSEQVVAWLDAFVAHDPLNAGVRVHALEALAPDWGGSIEAMRRVADEAQTHVDRNPRLRIFPGYVEAELAMAAWRAEDLRAAAKHYRRALAHGDHFAWNSGLSDVLNQLEDWNALEQVATAWLTTWPDDAIGYMWRGRARLKQGRSAEALADLEAGFERNPSHRYLLSLRAQALETLGRLPEAAAAYELVLEVAPGQPWASERLAEVRGRLEASREGARRMPGLAVIGIEGASAKGEGG